MSPEQVQDLIQKLQDAGSKVERHLIIQTFVDNDISMSELRDVLDQAGVTLEDCLMSVDEIAKQADDDPIIKEGQNLQSIAMAVMSGAIASKEELQFLIQKIDEVSGALKKLANDIK
jgi:hypothetical protein